MSQSWFCFKWNQMNGPWSGLMINIRETYKTIPSKVEDVRILSPTNLDIHQLTELENKLTSHEANQQENKQSDGLQNSKFMQISAQLGQALLICFVFCKVYNLEGSSSTTIGTISTYAWEGRITITTIIKRTLAIPRRSSSAAQSLL